MLMLPRLLVLVNRVGVVGKTRVASGSPAGEPPTQLALSDHSVLTAPVHWWAVGVTRSSSTSSRGRNDGGRPAARRPRREGEGLPLAIFRSQGVNMREHLLHFPVTGRRSAVQ